MGSRHKGLHASRFAGHVHFTVSDIDGGSTPLRDHPDGSGPITNSIVPRLLCRCVGTSCCREVSR